MVLVSRRSSRCRGNDRYRHDRAVGRPMALCRSQCRETMSLSRVPHLTGAVVTEIGGIISVTESAGRIRAGLARRYGPSLVLLEHHLAPESGEGMETLDLVRIGADGSPHWSRVWPTPQENPRHAGLQRWMAGYGHQIVGRPACWFDWRDDNNC